MRKPKSVKRRVLTSIAWVKVLVCLLLLLSLYCSQIPDQGYHPDAAPNDQRVFWTLEFNDQGQLHFPAQWQRLKSAIIAAGSSAEVMLFVHGWHHNAMPDDDNFIAFQRFAAQWQAQQPSNRIAVYVGWRGDRVDPFWLDGSNRAESVVESLDFPTIWATKATARTVGEQGLSVILAELAQLQTQQQMARYILLGHSLGGVVAFYASREQVLAEGLQPTSSPHLRILLNPALHANEYKPLDKLLSQQAFHPALWVLQSKGDYAVNKAFRWLQDGERAVGSSWAITHDVDRCPRNNCQAPLKLPQALQAHDAQPGCMMELPQVGWRIRARLQARTGVQSCADANQQLVWVLAVSDQVIQGHNGVLTADQGVALAALLQLAQPTLALPTEPTTGQEPGSQHVAAPQ